MPVRDAEGGARVSAVRDVRVELPRAGGEPLDVRIVEDDRPVADEQRPGVHEVAGRLVGGLRPRNETDTVAVGDDAGAAGSVGIDDRLVGQRSPVDPQVAERTVRVAQEEAADDRLVDLVRGAPDVETLGVGEVHHPHARRATWVPHRVERRHAAVVEHVPPQEVLDPVPVRLHGGPGSVEGVAHARSGLVVREQRAEQLVERRPVAARDDRRRHRRDGRGARDAHRERDLAEPVTGANHAPRAARLLRDRREAGQHHVEAVALLALRDDDPAGRQLLALHPLGEARKGLPGQRGEEGDA